MRHGAIDSDARHDTRRRPGIYAEAAPVPLRMLCPGRAASRNVVPMHSVVSYTQSHMVHTVPLGNIRAGPAYSDLCFLLP